MVLKLLQSLWERRQNGTLKYKRLLKYDSIISVVGKRKNAEEPTLPPQVIVKYKSLVLQIFMWFAYKQLIGQSVSGVYG